VAPVFIPPAFSAKPFGQPISSLRALITLSASPTTAMVARIERDEIEPRMTTLGKLARALGVDPTEPVE